uniref:Uncharacterized protein n=1 Tax=Caenorhabditis japonica TaxID=281687 RepID=A0A8R1IA70_CAEJA
MGRRAIVLKDTVLKFSIQRVVGPKDPSYLKIPYPKIHRTQRNRTQIWYPKSSRTQRAIVPKDPGPTDWEEFG